jgi:(4-(4-[2-(gamma-L-glutamylamino)ethyl]phenoxymethyl)furan-2-yl)methanamine synthase
MRMSAICTLGWDIGGVNTKVSRVAAGRVLETRVRPFEVQVEVQRDPHALVALLRALATESGATGDEPHAVTMTAELSQMFRTKADGVAFVLDAVSAAFPDADTYVYTTDERFVASNEARRIPLSVAAANWVATASIVARTVETAVLVDIGTTTTDVIPVVGGRVVACGRTDPARLATGELLYLGAVRTPVEAMVTAVPIAHEWVGVSAEGFALAGDVHVWRGTLSPAMYSITPPDGRRTTREFAGERLARVVCADRTMLDDAAIDAIADHVAASQIARTATAIRRVCAVHPTITTGVVAGIGAPIARAAVTHAGLTLRALADSLGAAGAAAAPSAAVALLLAEHLG